MHIKLKAKNNDHFITQLHLTIKLLLCWDDEVWEERKIKNRWIVWMNKLLF